MDLDTQAGGSSLGKWWPLLVAVLVAGIAVGFLPQLARTPEPAGRKNPLALSVDPSGTEWLITWNPRATAIRQARAGRLYVMGAGGEQATVELAQKILKSGEYRYARRHPQPTFRLEVEERSGHICAESFRFGPPLQ
ncbi:MAG TPA: hypothetical protein VNH18_07660 [Bryobacteraceae bacterium]|nr:hypothetical protein [Bryobacteraceae bacterium]